MNSKRISIILFVLVLILSGSESNGQQQVSLSLKEAQEYALEHNYTLMNARKDVIISREKVSETTAIGLPQLNASVSYNNYLDIPTQLIPDFLSPAVIAVNQEIFGLEPTVPLPDEPQYFEAKFGLQHNMTWGATVSQLLFSGPYIVGLQAARAYVDLSKSIVQKNEIDIRTNVAKAYYPIIILSENRSIMDSSMATLRDMLEETTAIYESGFMEDTDVDQLELLVSEMESTILNIDNQIENSRNLLKLNLGMDPETDILVTDNLNDFMAGVNREYLLNTPFDPENNIELKVIKNQEELAQLDIKRQRSEYLPSLSAFYSYQENGMRDEFNFFDFSKEWFPTQVLGAQLDIPIWSSGSRKSKIDQAKLNLEKLNNMREQLEQSLSLTAATERSEFNRSYLEYVNKNKSADLSRKIHQKTEIKYREGIASSLELSQTYNQYMQAEINRLLAILELLNKKSDLENILTKVNN